MRIRPVRAAVITVKQTIKTSLLLFLFLFSAPETIAQGSDSFTVGPLTARRGERVSGIVEVPAGVDEGTQIPVTIFHGAEEGPVLALIAGVHGYEYPPITALQRVRHHLDPSVLSGTVVMVHVANMPSFLKRTIYYSPVDGKNLNRVYPGDPNGTVSDRIAHIITTEVIEQADYVVDLHCGDGNEALRPYTYWMLTGNDELDQKSKHMAIVFGLDHIVIDTDRPKDPNASLYTANTALTRGIPGITTETGQMGTNDPHWVEMAEHGIWNLLHHFKMVEGEVTVRDAIVWLDRYEVVRSPLTGMFHASVKDGYMVAEGALLGVLTDFFGDKIGEVHAPFDGVVNYVISTPPISEGEPVAMISHIKPNN